MSKRGLPTSVQMRHDAHYVEELSQRTPTSVGRMIGIELIRPNPEQPRVEIGDLTELIDSIKARGVLEPLLVKRIERNEWLLIAGERRWRAARAAALSEVPCIELEVDEQGIAEIALMENLQRKDLNIWEEADGLKSLYERFGFTQEEIARKLGKSRSSVSEALAIGNIPLELRHRLRDAGINNKATLLQILRQPDDAAMGRMVQLATEQGLDAYGAKAARRALEAGSDARALRQAAQRAKPLRFEISTPATVYKISITGQSANDSGDKIELIRALEALIRQIKDSPQLKDSH